MSHSEFKARALYDFAAEGPNELSFRTGEILTITSNTAGNGWWFAKNQFGQVGVIPENYVEALADPPEPNEPPPPPSLYPSTDVYNNVTRSSYPDPPVYMNPITNNTWQTSPTENYNNPMRPVRPAPPIPFANRAKAKLLRVESLSNGYGHFIDLPSPHHSIAPPSPIAIGISASLPILASQNSRTSIVEDEEGWYGTLPKTPPAILSTNSERFFDSLPLVETNCSSTKKRVRKKHKRFFPFIRSKKLKSIKEVSHQSNKHDTDSDDDFSDTEYPSSTNNFNQSNTLTHNPSSLNSTRPSLANVEPSRAAPKARFFDKHGLDSYLLNGAKTKSDELVEITIDENGGVVWSPNPTMPPFTCKVENPSKEKKLAGLKQFIEYKIHAQIPGAKAVGRRYKQFDWLHEQLVSKFRFICVPPLPGKQIAGRFEDVFIEERRRLLELWLNRICRHPVLCATQVVQHFITCELSERNKKDWKTGKRKAEKDESKEAAWLQCVSLIRTGLTDQQIQSQIDAFNSQQPGLESQLKNLSQGINKYLERHTEVYERDLIRLSELFIRVHNAVQADTVTPGNRDLSQSINKIGESYRGMAELYRNDAIEGLRDFNEHLQEYIGLLGCFPSILSIQRSATDFMRTVHQRAPSTNNDFSSAIHRNHVLNHVVLAEINFFQKEKVTDLNVFMRSLVHEQIQFYEKITEQLRDASHSFK